jgi:hypothetical protein
MTASGLKYSASFPEKRFGKVSMLNGDGSVITTGTIVPVKQSMQCFGKFKTVIVLQIKSNDDGVLYEQVDWIDKYNRQVERESIYASDVQKEIDATCSSFAPPTPRPRAPSPVQRTVFGMRSPECEWF